MIRIHIICEGQTEEAFVNNLLAQHFAQQGVMLYPSLIGKPGHKGGFVNINRLFIDIRNRLLGDKTSWCTTFFDYYGLPCDFPGKSEADRGRTAEEKASRLLAGLMTTLGEKIGIRSRSPLKIALEFVL
jgi:hypothetical protein